MGGRPRASAQCELSGHARAARAISRKRPFEVGPDSLLARGLSARSVRVTMGGDFGHGYWRVGLAPASNRIHSSDSTRFGRGHRGVTCGKLLALGDLGQSCSTELTTSSDRQSSSLTEWWREVVRIAFSKVPRCLAPGVVRRRGPRCGRGGDFLFAVAAGAGCGERCSFRRHRETVERRRGGARAPWCWPARSTWLRQ